MKKLKPWQAWVAMTNKGTAGGNLMKRRATLTLEHEKHLCAVDLSSHNSRHLS